MRKKLRPYQQTIVDEIKRRLKESDDPILVDASVGSGKSLILSTILLMVERAGFRALCLTLNSTLIKQNADTYKLQGGNPGIYCAGLNAKDTENLVIFASPHSVCQDIRNKEQISRQPFQLVVIDEVHNVDPSSADSMFMRILNHYSMMAQTEQYKFKIIGLTGTPYRGKGESIVGPTGLFKTKACEVSTSWLIQQGFLTKPYFGLPQVDSFDFSQLRIKNTGKFDQKQLAQIVDENDRLTGEIMREITSVVENGRNGAFIFASTKKHCLECAKSLPDGQWAIITGDTPHEERARFLEMARNSVIRYLISVNCLDVGVDITNFDVIAWLRPTESLVKFTQGNGRGLRLHPGKELCVILDYAGNLQRHGDIDDPIINEALQPREENEKDYCIPCYTCGTNNTLHARRCIGVVRSDDSVKRCDHYFEFKPCHVCAVQNDITARHCRSCDAELIDPNSKLNRNNQTITVAIVKGEYWVTAQKGGFPIINCRYYAASGWNYTELFYTNTDKSRNICYAKFIRTHINGPSEYYMKLSDYRIMLGMIENDVKTPHSIVVINNEDGSYKLVKKLFD
jgi:DNA repair protein RadD